MHKPTVRHDPVGAVPAQTLRICRRSDEALSLVEILIVMIVIRLLAAIAIPRFPNQRAKAYDSTTKADVSVPGKEVPSYFVDRSGTLVLDFATTPGRVLMSDGSGPTR